MIITTPSITITLAMAAFTGLAIGFIISSF